MERLPLTMMKYKWLLIMLFVGGWTLPAFSQNGLLVTDLLSHNNTGDYLLLTTEYFSTQALELATYRKSSKRDLVDNPKIILLSAIKSQFQTGTVADKIREFLKYANSEWQDNWLDKTVLIIGDISENQGDSLKEWYFPSHIPIKFNGDSSAVSDDWFVIFDTSGTFYYPEYQIGRIPAKTSQELQNVIDKTKKFEGTMCNSRIKMVQAVEAVYDYYGLETLFYNNFKKTIISSPKEFNTFPVYSINSKYSPVNKNCATDSIVNYINSGVSIVSFYGSTTYSFWGADSFFIIDSVIPRFSTDKLFILTSFTPMNAMFQKNVSSIGENLLFCNNKGAVAVLGSASMSLGIGAVDEFHRNMLLALSADTGKICIGAIIKNAKYMSEDKYTTDRFLLLGDPALTIPHKRLQIANADTSVLKGTTINYKGRTQSIPNGQLKVGIYGSAKHVDSFIDAKIHIDHYNPRPLIDSFTTMVSDNLFSFNYTIPTTVDITQPIKVSFYAFDTTNEEIGDRFINTSQLLIKKLERPNSRNNIFSIAQKNRKIIFNFEILPCENNTISIFNIQGCLIAKLENIKNQQYIMDCSNIPTGFYIIRAKSGNRLGTQKLIITK